MTAIIFKSLLLLFLSLSVFADKPNANPNSNPKPDLFLLKTYQPTQSVVGWVMSEKLDGIRGFWNGQQLLTRSGKPINAPAWFTQSYPPFAIDGELWTKQANFANISSIVRRKIPDDRWQTISHQIFEVPNQPGGLLARLSVLETYLAKHPNTPIQIIKQHPITQQNQVKQFLNIVVKSSGEGIVVRNPNTPYQTGRLSSALKVKKYQDAECIVQKTLLGKGKYIHKMGAIVCQIINGTAIGQTIKIGSGFNDYERTNPPKIGSQVTFKYYGLTKNNKPRFPVFLRVRDEFVPKPR